MLPFTLVDSQEFIDFCNELDPRYTVPDRRHFAEKAIPALFNEVKSQVKAELKEVDFVSCTTDGWSSCTTQPYLSLTVHFISPSWSMKTYCLRTIYMPTCHTGENVANMLKSILKEYDIMMSQVTSFTTDSAANMIKACKDLEVTRAPCFGHILHNSITNSIKGLERVDDMVKTCRKVVTTFSHSFR